MERYTGFLGILLMLGIAFLMSNNRKKINYRLVIWGLSLQIAFALLILKTPVGLPFFKFFDLLIARLLSYADKGGDFLFKSFISGVVDEPNLNFAIRVLPTVIFFSALVSLLYYLGIMQRIVKGIAWVVQKTMKTSGSETLVVAGSIFLGQTEAPLLVKPFIKKMTKSELMTIMVAGFATIAGGVMAIYVKMLEDIPGIAGHLMAASIMNAPAALIIAKIMLPETEDSETKNSLDITIQRNGGNVIEAVGDGAIDGMKLAANIGAMLIAVVALIAMLDGILGYFNTSFSETLGFILRPMAWSMGVPWNEAGIVGGLMGEKLVLTELIAYADLQDVLAQNALSQRSAIIASYALCGFANFASIGIQLGGLGGIAPDRKKDVAKLATKAMIGGAIATNLTACIAGILI
jgi:CNT family concentrative nucleoside transporter